MRVLFASHLFPNRQEPLKGVFVLELARALARLAQVEVVAPLPVIPWLRPFRHVPRSDVMEGIRVVHPRYLALPSMLYAHRWRTYHGAWRSCLAGREQLPDVVHVHWTYPDAYAVLRWAQQRDLPVVLTVHGHAAFGWKEPPRHRRCYNQALRGVRRIISVSGEIRDQLIRESGVLPERIDVIHNGVDMDRFPPVEAEAARRRLGLPLNKKIILCVARLSPEKALGRLMLQTARLKGRHDWGLHIVGEGPLQNALRTMVDEQGLGGRVHLEGGVSHDKLRDWYAAADVFCLTSLHEGCPVVVHEALACGLPVVSTRVGAVPDLIQEGVNGLLCRVDHDEDIADQLDKALCTRWDRKAIVETGRQHTWDAVAARTMDVYAAALAEKGGGNACAA